MPSDNFENHVFLVLMYIVCLVYLYRVNSEYPSMILLALVNFVYIFFYFPIISNDASLVIFRLKIPVQLMILINWSLLMVANIWSINNNMDIRNKFSKKNQKANLGKKKNYTDKMNLKILITCGTLSVLVLHLLSLESFVPKLSYSNIGIARLVSSVVGLAFSIASVQLSGEIIENTRIITSV